MGYLHHDFQENGDLVSPWHDIPLYNREDRTNQTLNMVVEIPRFSQVRIMSSFGNFQIIVWIGNDHLTIGKKNTTKASFHFGPDFDQKGFKMMIQHSG